MEKYHESSSGLELQLHPLVLLNISDHWTRMRAVQRVADIRVLGCLLGQQNGRVVEISNSFELSYSGGTDGSPIAINKDFLKRKQEQYNQVFPQLEIVGWYSTGSDIELSDMDIHKWIAGVNENPLYLLFDPALRDTDGNTAATSTGAASANASKQLPVYVFESELRLASAEEQQKEEEGRAGGSANVLQASTLVFTRSSYVIETVEAERIAVDQVAKIEAGSGQSSSVTRLASNLTGVHSAIKMLNARIKVIHDFLLDTKSGKIPTDHGLLRQISSITHSLPTMQSASFRDELVREHNDTMLLSYLAVMTAGTADINSIAEKQFEQ